MKTKVAKLIPDYFSFFLFPLKRSWGGIQITAEYIDHFLFNLYCSIVKAARKAVVTQTIGHSCDSLMTSIRGLHKTKPSPPGYKNPRTVGTVVTYGLSGDGNHITDFVSQM